MTDMSLAEVREIERLHNIGYVAPISLYSEKLSRNWN